MKVKTSAIKFITTLMIMTIALGALAQNEAIYVTKKRGEKERTILTLDFSKIKKPATIEEMDPVFHNDPIPQDTTGTCWCFATTSFLESEIYRLYGKKVKLSEMYPVYYEYLAKVRRFVKEKGDSYFGQGSEHNAVIRQMKDHGAVPLSDYTGLVAGRTGHHHGSMYWEIRNYLHYVEDHKYWHEDQIMDHVRNILNRYIGKPPETITIEGKTMTPKEYLNNVLKLPLDEYIAFMSTTSEPFYTKAEYEVPDNWWHSDEYHNVPLEDFYGIIKRAIRNDYSVAIGGDVSEPGKNGEAEVAIIPSFDTPEQYIDQDSREFRFYNHTSTDDHAIHLIGYKQMDNHDWFLIKDSGRSARRGPHKGYYFFRDDFIKLKMLTILVHQDMAKDILNKFEF